ncbi:hypothetical protein RHODO2019_00575 [Rhodococcus antarcticus]|uniref:Uncharacterized protein n=1 Tax=Rhodococcus antarcticus TaxID=2987751 RepID=A0ABY6P056_9NOCA|nr:hypothetical protein [Rhodococcus antarcticus]UZJ25045.1 hypothetical protein RHODO2019_00575 [Rhodococcus antarcticus]
MQDLGLRRTSFVRRASLVPRAVDELHRILVGPLPGHPRQADHEEQQRRRSRAVAGEEAVAVRGALTGH